MNWSKPSTESRPKTRLAPFFLGAARAVDVIIPNCVINPYGLLPIVSSVVGIKPARLLLATGTGPVSLSWVWPQTVIGSFWQTDDYLTFGNFRDDQYQTIQSVRSNANLDVFKDPSYTENTVEVRSLYGEPSSLLFPINPHQHLRVKVVFRPLITQAVTCR
jgi:hypothetical protein